MVELIIGAFVLSAVAVVLIGLVRTTERAAAQTMRAVTSSPWNDIEAAPARQVQVGAVLALDDELLVELLWDRGQSDQPARRSWLLAPFSIAAIITLSRWRDARCTVMVQEQCGRSLLRTGQGRLALRAAPVSGRAPTV